MESEIMLSTEAITIGIAAAGSVGGVACAAARAVWVRLTVRTDELEEEMATLHGDLLECEKKHASTTERIGKLEGWREGFADAKASDKSKPLTETDTA